MRELLEDEKEEIIESYIKEVTTAYENMAFEDFVAKYLYSNEWHHINNPDFWHGTKYFDNYGKEITAREYDKAMERVAEIFEENDSCDDWDNEEYQDLLNYLETDCQKPKTIAVRFYKIKDIR